MLQPLILLILGLIGLWIGAILIIESAKKLAVRIGISQTLIGLSIISIGTSLPEIMTNVISGIGKAHGTELSGIAIGTNIGSCLTQITLIFGLTSLFGKIHAKKKILKRDGLMVLFAIALMFLMGLDGIISRVEGFLLIVIYLSYLFYICKDEHVISKVNEEFNHKDTRAANIRTFIFMLIGIFLLLYASNLVVDNAVALSEAWGVAQSFIGVMIVGVGTGLPEFLELFCPVLLMPKTCCFSTLHSGFLQL